MTDRYRQQKALFAGSAGRGRAFKTDGAEARQSVMSCEPCRIGDDDWFVRPNAWVTETRPMSGRRRRARTCSAGRLEKPEAIRRNERRAVGACCYSAPQVLVGEGHRWGTHTCGAEPNLRRAKRRMTGSVGGMPQRECPRCGLEFLALRRRTCVRARSRCRGFARTS